MLQDFHKEKKIILKLINSFYSGVTISNFQVFELFEQDFNNFNGWEKSNNLSILMEITRNEPFTSDEQKDIRQLLNHLSYETSVEFNCVN